jgi:hypothetical protein
MRCVSNVCAELNRKESMAEEQVNLEQPPTAADVLQALLHEEISQVEAPDKITVERATDFQYACRVYPQGGGDFEGVLLTFSDGA